MIITFNEFEQ